MLNKRTILIISLIIISVFIINGCGSNSVSDGSDSNLAVEKSLNIIVIDEDTQDLLSDVNLTIQTDEGEITGTSDSNGLYSVNTKFIEGDNYNVTTNRPGYEEKTVKLNIPISDNISLDISLKNNPEVAYVKSNQELEDSFQDSNINTIILGYNITIDGEYLLVIPRDLTIDGDNQYKVTGAGYLTIRPEKGNHDLTFKNFIFDPDDDITKWFEDLSGHYYYLSKVHDTNNNGYVVNTSFENCEVDTVDNKNVPGAFFIDTSGGDLTVINSDINIENHSAFDQNRGGRTIIKNNNFNQTGTALNSNNHVETSIDIENNNFEDLPSRIFYLNTTFNNTNPITVNGNDLRPIDETVTKVDFEDDALLIHQIIGDMNTVASDYLTTYYDNDNAEGYFLYEGNSTNPLYP